MSAAAKEALDEAAVEKTWQDEIARRAKEIDEGSAEFVSWEEVKGEIAKRLRERSTSATT